MGRGQLQSSSESRVSSPGAVHTLLGGGPWDPLVPGEPWTGGVWKLSKVDAGQRAYKVAASLLMKQRCLQLAAALLLICGWTVNRLFLFCQRMSLKPKKEVYPFLKFLLNLYIFTETLFKCNTKNCILVVKTWNMFCFKFVFSYPKNFPLKFQQQATE